MAANGLLHIIIICSRNRPDELERAVRMALNQRVCHSNVIVVDSSDLPTKSVKSFEGQPRLHGRLTYVSSEPGLPHQRNVGRAIALERSRAWEDALVHFIDDDVMFDVDFCQGIEGAYLSNPQAVLLGPVDEASVAEWAGMHLFRRFMRRRLQGRITKAGFNYPIVSVNDDTSVQWLPGLAWTFPFRSLSTFAFNENIQFSGEDLDTCLRLQQIGPIVCTPRSFVRHCPSTVNRVKTSDAIARTHAVRWMLAEEFPSRISRLALILSVLVAIAGSVSTIFLSCGTKGRDSLAGHVRFFPSLVARIPWIRRNS